MVIEGGLHSMSVPATQSNQSHNHLSSTDALETKTPPISDHPWLTGSACLLGVFVGLQLMVATFPLVPVPEEQAQIARLTDRGRSLYIPENDLYVYMGGCLLSVLAPPCLLWVCHRVSRWRTGTDFPPDSLQRAVAWAWFGTVLAAALLSGDLSLSTPSAMPVLLVDLAVVTLAVGLLAPVVVGASVSVRSCSVGSATNWSYGCDGLWFLCTILLVILVLSVRDAAGLAGRIYELEKFHHWDFFVMGPALQCRHGRALGSEGYAQYGVGFPLLAEGLSQLIPLRYDNLLRIGINLGCIYFTALALLLRMILGNRLWATIGLILALCLQTFTGVGRDPSVSLWMYPSSTVLRHIFDVWYFMALWLHVQSRRVIWAVCCGIALGLSLIWELDTGIYILAVSSVYIAICMLKPSHSPAGRWTGPLVTPLAIFGAATPIVVAAWYRASRGSLGLEFFQGILEALRSYPAGIGCLPFFSLDKGYVIKFMIVAGTYLFVIAKFLVKLTAKEEPSRVEAFNGCLGAYGLALLLLFIQRSHPNNLSHGIVPFVILATEGGLSTVHWLSKWMLSPDRAVLVVSAVTLLVMAAILVANPNLRAYPGWWQTRLASSESRPVSLGTVVGVNGLSPDYAAQAAHFRSLTSRLAELRKSGKRVAIISDFDPIYCLAAGVPPVDRYSPLSGHLLKEPLRNSVRKFRDTPFDFVCIETEPPSPSLVAFQDVLQHDYTLWERHGCCSILRRRTISRPDGLSTVP